MSIKQKHFQFCRAFFSPLQVKVSISEQQVLLLLFFFFGGGRRDEGGGSKCLNIFLLFLDYLVRDKRDLG